MWRFCVALVIVFSPGSGLCATACLRQRCMHFGWGMTPSHILELEKRMRCAALQMMTDNTLKAHFNPKALSILGKIAVEDELPPAVTPKDKKRKAIEPSPTEPVAGGEEPAPKKPKAKVKKGKAKAKAKAKPEADSVAEENVEEVVEVEEGEDVEEGEEASDWELSPAEEQ